MELLFLKKSRDIEGDTYYSIIATLNTCYSNEFLSILTCSKFISECTIVERTGIAEDFIKSEYSVQEFDDNLEIR